MASDMARIDDYKWGLEYEELEGLYMMALHELDAKDERIAELEKLVGSKIENTIEALQIERQLLVNAMMNDRFDPTKQKIEFDNPTHRKYYRRVIYIQSLDREIARRFQLGLSEVANHLLSIPTKESEGE